jgi:hypothetical protein
MVKRAGEIRAIYRGTLGWEGERCCAVDTWELAHQINDANPVPHSESKKKAQTTTPVSPVTPIRPPCPFPPIVYVSSFFQLSCAYACVACLFLNC